VHGRDLSLPFWQATSEAPREFERLVRHVEWKLIEMPLPRLQLIGDGAHPFIYEMGWPAHIRNGDVRRYQEGRDSPFDNRLLLRAGVGQYPGMSRIGQHGCLPDRARLNGWRTSLTPTGGTGTPRGLAASPGRSSWVFRTTRSCGGAGKSLSGRTATC